MPGSKFSGKFQRCQVSVRAICNLLVTRAAALAYPSKHVRYVMHTLKETAFMDVSTVYIYRIMYVYNTHSCTLTEK